MSTIILAVQRVSVVSYSYRGQARKRRDTAWRLSLWLQQNCPGNNEFTDQPVCKSPDLLNFIFEEKDRLLWIFLKVCRSVRLIQSRVIMLLTKSWSPDIFNSKSKECTQNSYFLYKSKITLKRFWVKWVTKQQNTVWTSQMFHRRKLIFSIHLIQWLLQVRSWCYYLRSY